MFDSAQMPCGERQAFVARAAIEAMREPTAEMLHGEPCMAGGKSYLVPVMEIWPKMIDAALSEKS
jgi:hypothetical protein